tara:strand:+ start:1102 stop:1755 length:654 start_codon:yes stop_codon:yes gene_type:complete
LLNGIAATVEHEDLIRGINPPNTIIDIGSNKGQFMMLIEKMFPNKIIYSFEPIEEMLQKQKKFFYYKKNVFFNNFALGNEISKKDFFITNRKDSSSFLKIVENKNKSKNYEIKEKRQIQINTLDNYFLDKNIILPILIKIDVQGFELEVLKGSKELLKKTDYLLLEVSDSEMYRSQASEVAVIEFLKRLNFQIYKSSNWKSIKNTSFNQRDILFKKE